MNKVLGDIAKLQGGYAYKSRDLGEVGLPVVKIGDVTGGGSISYGNMQKIPLSIATETERFATNAGDTLISMTGANVGKVARVGDNDPAARINQRVGRFVPIAAAGYCKDYIHYIVSSKPAYLFFANAAYGSAQPNISGALIESLPVPEIEPDVANKIGKMLASLDHKIELNRRMNETLEEMARALFRDWFVDFGPTRRQMEGETSPAAIMGHAFAPGKATTLAPLFPAKLGDDGLPEGWHKLPVGELAEIVGGGTPNTKTEEFWEGGTHLWATPRDLSKLSGVFISDTERKLTDAGLAKVSSGLSPTGSVLMSSRAPIGYLAIASQPVAVNQGFIVMRPSDQFPTHFAKLWCEANMETIEANANGSTFQEISKKNFKPILATVPSAKVMAAFSTVAGLLFEKVQANEQENQTLAALRDLLLPKLMSGEIRLKDAEAAL